MLVLIHTFNTGSTATNTPNGGDLGAVANDYMEGDVNNRSAGAGKPTKKRRTEEDLQDGGIFDYSKISAQPSLDEIKSLISLVDEHRDTLLSWLCGERVSERKTKLREAIRDFSAIVTLISNAYLYKLGADSVANECKVSIVNACKGVEKAVETLSNPDNSSSNESKQSYANVAGYKRANQNISTSSISLGRGKSFPISTSQRVIIGPSEQSANEIKNCKQTKDTLQKCINPTEFKMQIKGLRFGPNRCVMLEGNELNVTELQKCSAITEAGLEVKNESLWNPRLIVHDIPVDMERESILNCIREQNLPHANPDDIVCKYLYPARDKKFRSCVIELPHDCRRQLLRAGRVNIGWSACRVDDHVSIIQCYNCMGFGHIASKCSKNACCGLCAQDHLTSDCKLKSKKNFKCANCSAAKSNDACHSATDKSRCSILRKKIEQRIPFVNYGE